MSISEIHALLALMDDPDETVYDHVRDRLLSRGKDVLPFVSDAALSGRNAPCSVAADQTAEASSNRTFGKSWRRGWMRRQDIWAGAQLIRRAVDPAWQVADRVCF